MNYSEKLVFIRSKKSWNQAEAGEALGISQRTVSSIEQGTRSPSKKIAFKINELVGVCKNEVSLISSTAASPSAQITVTGTIDANRLISALEAALRDGENKTAAINKLSSLLEKRDTNP